MKRRFILELNEETYKRLVHIQQELGYSNRQITIRALINSRKIKPKVSKDVLALASVIYMITARVEILLASSYTRAQVTTWLKYLIKASKMTHKIISRYDKH